MAAMDENIDTVYIAVGECLSSGLDNLSKIDDFKYIDLASISKITLEYILFILHCCDRAVFSILGPTKRKVIMDQVLLNVFHSLEKYDDNFLRKIYGEKTDANLTQYFDYLSRMAPSIDFRNKYNERQNEYSQYKEILPEKDKPLKNTLVWEFSKKVLAITNMTSPEIMFRISFHAAGLVVACKEMLQACLKEGD